MNQTEMEYPQDGLHFADADRLTDTLRELLTVALAPRGVAPASLRILARWKAAGHKATTQTNAALRGSLFSRTERKKASTPRRRPLCATKLAA